MSRHRRNPMNVFSVSAPAPPSSLPAEPTIPQPLKEDQRALIRAVKAVNAANLFGQENELTFVIDRATRRAVARIVNKLTHEVIDQIPSEVVLRMAEEVSRD
jgi:uncharacterized FlaG/YvyC family protein